MKNLFLLTLLAAWISCSAGTKDSDNTGKEPQKPIDPPEEVVDLTLGPNPFITKMYTADPSAHVWADGRLYVYASHDNEPAYGCDMMDKYHVFSTDNMKDWIDHGQILEASQVPWGEPIMMGDRVAPFMWAPDCAYKNGKYYFYFPHPSGNPWNSTWKIGIAVSDKPAEGFECLDFTLKGLPDDGFIDPCVFVDDDGQAYFYYGGGKDKVGHQCWGGKLKDNMTEIDGELKRMDQTLPDFHEAAWVHKRGDTYYLSYSDRFNEKDENKNWLKGNRLRYATSKSSLGPWKALDEAYGGIYMDSTGPCETIHGSIVKFKGQWYAFYHNNALWTSKGGNPNEGNRRSICVDKLYYDDKGNIKKVVQTNKVPAIKAQ